MKKYDLNNPKHRAKIYRKAAINAALNKCDTYTFVNRICGKHPYLNEEHFPEFQFSDDEMHGFDDLSKSFHFLFAERLALDATVKK